MSSTICALATPPGAGGIAVVRVSGPEAYAVVGEIFTPRNPAKQVAEAKGYTAMLGHYHLRGEEMDETIALFFRAPHSYTGEDVIELSVHGGNAMAQGLLEALYLAGAAPAGPGEFTKRAFLNGQLDLLQAESVADLIDAETAQQAHNAVCQLDGALSRTVARIYDGLMDMAARFYAVVDYPDEDIEDLQREQMLDTLRRAQNDLEALVAGFSRGRLLKLGVPTVLLGKPNAGKSSLLNALLGYDRAIVTDIAGTTRDTVEEKVTVGGVLLRLIDTAGIRDGGDAVETMGVERSRAAAKQASLALLVLDGSRALTAEDEAAIALANTVPHLIVAVNKSDLPRALDIGALADRFDNVLSVSAATGAGLDTLTDAIAAQFPAGESTGGALLTNARQADAANRALSAVAEARGALRIGMTPDVVLTDCEAALAALGELNGKQVRDDLVDTIFSRFCVGK